MKNISKIYTTVKIKFPCANKDCPKLLDGKCSVWKTESGQCGCPEFKSSVDVFGETLQKTFAHCCSEAEKFSDAVDAMTYAMGSTCQDEEPATRNTPLEYKRAELEFMQSERNTLTEDLQNHNKVIDSLKMEIRELEHAQRPRLKVISDGDLYILYGDEIVSKIMYDSGDFYLYHQAYHSLKQYNKWRRDYEDRREESIDRTPVEWKGRMYYITKGGKLSSFVGRDGHAKEGTWTQIYDYVAALPSTKCKDKNILRTEHNKRVVIF